MTEKSLNAKQHFLQLPEDIFIIKYSNYFEIYDKHFKFYQNKADVRILEIGLLDGGSIEFWRQYFGSGLTYYGIDINPDCKNYEREGVHIFIGSQSDEKFLKSVIEQVPEFDIIIDDGGHTMKHQTVSFECLFGHVKDGGSYLCEDTHTSYLYPFGGGYKRSSSFIEYSKSLVDKLYAWHPPFNNPNYYTKNIGGIHFYDGVVVFDKRKVAQPSIVTSGKYSGKNKLYVSKNRSKLFYIFHKNLNKALAFWGFKGYDYVFWE